MKYLYFILCFAACLLSQAQVPQRMNYQTVVRGTNNALINNTAVVMRISLLPNSPSDASVYTELHTTTTNLNGWLSLEIGGGQAIAGSFQEVEWSTGAWFVQSEVDVNNTGDFVLLSTQPLLSVPFAFHAQTAERLTGPVQENDPLFAASLAADITAADTAYWNQKQDALVAGAGIEISGDTIRNTLRYVGEVYGGGVVVAVWTENNVQHGLIAALDNIGNALWSNVNVDMIGAAAQSKSSGQSNTDAIIGQAGHTASAALLCANYVTQAYDDWYLPSLWELEQFSRILFTVEQLTGQALFGQFTWSSTEVEIPPAPGFINSSAYGISLGWDEVGTSGKNTFAFVRPFRRF